MQREETTSNLSKPDPGARFPEAAVLVNLTPLCTWPSQGPWLVAQHKATDQDY